MAESTEELREKVAVSCRILAMEGLVDEILGHVSARIADTDEMWIRCRSPEEEGVRYTTVDAIQRVDFDGKGPHKGEQYQVPNELPIHGEIYKKRPAGGLRYSRPSQRSAHLRHHRTRVPSHLRRVQYNRHAHGARGYPGVSALLSRQPAGARCSDDRNHG